MALKPNEGLVDFGTVLKTLLAAFEKANIRYALIGGLALGLWGVARATVDLDFLIEQDDMAKVHDILTALGYHRHYQSVNVSQYRSDLRLWGQIDILHALRPAARGMIGRAVTKKILKETVAVRVVTVEDLIGLKVQSLVNDSTRLALDQADIAALLRVHGQHLDWQLVEEYFELFQQTALWQRLRGEYGQAQ